MWSSNKLRVAALMTAILIPGLARGADDNPAPATQPDSAVMELIQKVEHAPPQGERNAGLCNVRVHGDFVYVALQRAEKIAWFRRGADGKLTEAGRLDTAAAEGARLRSMLFVGGRLYMLSIEGGRRTATKVQLVRFDIDAKSGQPSEAGRVDSPVVTSPSVSYEPLQASPDGRSIYFLAMPRGGRSAVVHFRLDEAGKPSAAGQVSGKGIGPSNKPIGDSTLCIAPDGRHLYTISAADHAVAIVRRAEDGSLKFVKSLDLTPLSATGTSGAAWQREFAWPALAGSPDGRFVYVDLWAYGGQGRNCVGLYRRDATSGDLTLVGRLGWPAAFKGMRMAFTPDGLGGFVCGISSPATQFARDPATGRLSLVKAFAQTAGPERRGPCLYDMTYDAKGGYVYFADLHGKLFIFRTPEAKRETGSK